MKPHRHFIAFNFQVLFAAMLLIAVCVNVNGQAWTQYDQGTPPQHAAGVSPVGSYVSSDLGTVNLSNGALNLSLPMGTVGGRGFSVPLSLSYSSKVWSVAHESVYDPVRRRDFSLAYAQYGAEESYVDIYNRIAAGWTISGVPLLKRTGVALQPCEQGYNVYGLTKLTVVLPDKGEIELRDDLSDGAPLYLGCTPNEYRGRRWHATDGSGAVFISDNDNGIIMGDSAGTLITADGTRYRFQNPSLSGGSGAAFGRCVSITDRNGNQISINHFNDPNNFSHIETDYTDQLGRVIKVEENAPDPANQSVILPLLVTLKGYQGTPQYYKVTTDLLKNHIRSDFNYNQQPIVTGYKDNFGYCYQGGQPPAYNYLFPTSYCQYQERIDLQPQVNQVILPDGRALSFSYNLYGELAEVVLPTGAKMQYDYNGFVNGFPAGNTLPMEYQAQGNAVPYIDRAVIERRTYPDGATLEGTFTYAFAPQSVNGASYACAEAKIYAGTSTGTLLSDQRHFFLPTRRYLTGAAGSVSGTGYSLWSTGFEWRTETLDSAGGVMNASEQDWAQRTPVSWSSGYTQEQPANDNRVSEGRRYLDTGSLAKTDTFYDNDPTHYPRVNNVSEVKEYDFDQSLKRRTTSSYVTGGYQTDDSIHLLSLVQQQSVYDGPGTNEVARTVNEYDVYGDSNHAPLQDYGAVTGHDTAYGLSKVTRGNLTGTGRWLKTNGTTLYSYLSYDTLGNPVSNKDPKGNVTSLSYQDDFGNGSNPGTMTGGNYGGTYSLPTSITSPPPTPAAPVHTARTQFDFWSGLLTGFKDRNGVITQTIYNDPFSRPTLVKSALGISGVESHAAMYYAPTTAFGITLTNNDVLTAKDQATLDDATLRSWTHTDGFGRTVETWSRDPQGDDKVVTIYDALGRVRQQSNPYRPSQGESAIYSSTVYDLAGRVTSVTTPDSAVVSTDYSGNTVTVSDQAGKKRRSVTDGLGRLIRVDEPDASGNLDVNGVPVQSTIYTYDTLDNLIAVNQGTQTRTFFYDSLKRLLSATNPESGTICYGTISTSGECLADGYDANGNLLKKADARGVVSAYAYDALNRNTGVTYTNDPANTPAVTRTFDGATNGKGRLWKTETSGSNGSRTTVNSYDAFGRPVTESQQFFTNNDWGVPFTLSAIYNLAGAITSETYPSGHAINATYSTAGRLSSFTGNLGDGATRTYATGLTYSTLGGLKQEQFGANVPLYHRLRYNVRGQLYDVRVSSVQADELNWNRGFLAFYYGGAAWGESSTANNGNLTTQQHFVPGDDALSSYSMMQQNYSYDALNRLEWMGEYANGQTLVDAQNYSYDRYGNKTTGASWNLPYKQFSVDASTNRLLVPNGQSGTMHYDNAGNLDIDTYSGSALARTYDAESRMKSETQSGDVAGSYTYDADGHRVRRMVGGVETWQVYGFSGELLVEYAANASPASPQKEYGYRNGQLLITADGVSSSPVAVVIDNFNDNSLDPAKWDVFDTNSPATVSEQSQQLRITLPPNTAGYNGVVSKATYDLRGQSLQVEVAQPVSQGGWTENYLQVMLDAQNYYLIDVGSGSMLFRSMVNGVNEQTAIAYDPTALPYWRVRHDQAANTVSLETSSNGTDWTNRKTVTASFSLAAMKVYLMAGAWGTGNGGPGAAKYDNLQLVSGGGSGSGGVSNVALNKPATQVSEGWGGVPSRAVDGNTNGNYWSNSVTHTQGGNQDWWQVDLGRSYALETIKVWNRTDCCGERLSNFYVFVSDQPFSSYDLTTTINQAGVSNYYTAGQGGTPTFISANRTGRYVRVQLSAPGLISLAEVEVMGATVAMANINWLVTDQLGTPRMIFDKTGSLATTSRHDYLPFGEELFAGTGGRTTPQGYPSSPNAADGVRQKFTEYEHDNETSLDYAKARYFANMQGRFSSPDPIYFQAMMAVDPQRFNLYAYARNNPLKYADPNGERLHLEGSAINIMYEMAGGQESFDKYFVVINGEVLPQPGVSFEGANSGISQLLALVNSPENYLAYQGTSGEEAARFFEGTTNRDGELNDRGKGLAKIFNGGGNRTTGVGTLGGTSGRTGEQPAALANGDPVFAVIAINTNVKMEQKGVDDTYQEARGHFMAPIALEEQTAGVGQDVKAVSYVIHETAENLAFAQQRRNGEQYNYGAAHSTAMQREAVLRRDLGITGGFAGGIVSTTMPRRQR